MKSKPKEYRNDMNKNGIRITEVKDSDKGRKDKFQIKTNGSNYFSSVFIFICLLSLFAQRSEGYTYPQGHEGLPEIFGNLTRFGYDKRIRPAGENAGPCVVHVNALVRSIEALSELNMDFKMQITLRQQWTDPRLKFDNGDGRIQYLTITDTDAIWTPDLFFKNEKEARFHEVMRPNLYLRIFPNGDVLYSRRLSLTLSCPMNLAWYPFDRQQCQMSVASYAWTLEDITLLWKELNPVQVTHNLHLPEYTLSYFVTDYCNSKTNTGAYSCLVLKLFFERETSHHIVTHYIPCCMLVIISWIAFWLDQDALFARIAVVLTALVVMVQHISRITDSLPPVSYTKMIDIWTGTCLTFVFAALLEVALVNYVSQFYGQGKKTCAEQKPKDNKEETATKIEVEGDMKKDEPPKDSDEMTATSKPRTKFGPIKCPQFPSGSKRIDVVSRIAFPVNFLIFVAFYFGRCYTREVELY